MAKQSAQYRRMFETKGMRPYYSIPHVEIGTKEFKDWIGFEYTKEIDIVSAEMNNETYQDLNEMSASTEYFRSFWKDKNRVDKIIEDIKETFRKATEAERYGKKQIWKEKPVDELLKDMDLFYDLMGKSGMCMVVSQPQHVLPLDQQINELLAKCPNKDEVMVSATYVKGDLPWAEENRIIEDLHSTWKFLSEPQKQEKLEWLVKEYGWLNQIEGDQSFSKDHYRKKIEDFHPEPKNDTEAEVPAEIKEIGQLIGELSFLRFWGRHHLMTCRHYLMQVLKELISRFGNPDLEFATVEEFHKFTESAQAVLEEVRARKNGYGVYAENGKAVIVTGKRLEQLKELVKEDIADVREIKGVVANKGNVTGKVRVISFVAKDYNDQIAAFEKGEILITGMTRPQIVHLCQKASAIITDEGGITSHAAVIGREFGIPCIIATHNATRILKTGDVVEVDADNGIIRKIS